MLKPVGDRKDAAHAEIPGGVGGPFVSVVEYGFEQVGLVHRLHSNSRAFGREVQRGTCDSFMREGSMPRYPIGRTLRGGRRSRITGPGLAAASLADMDLPDRSLYPVSYPLAITPSIVNGPGPCDRSTRPSR